MMRRIFAPALLAAGLIFAPHAQAENTLTPLHFQSDGAFGSYDAAALQRGFLVYQSVCASCHAAGALHYRDLAALGFSPEQVAGIAGKVKLADGASATMDDVFKNPNMSAAAFGGALPPDLSNIVNERPGGPSYVYRYLTGFGAAPAGVTLLPGHHYNAAYPGNQTMMPDMLRGDDVSYADGTKASAAQEAADVSTFLAWAADPNLDARHAIGLRTVIFLVFLSLIALAAKRKVWREAA